MRLQSLGNGVESTRKGCSSSKYVFVCIARFWNHHNDKKFGQVLVKLQALYTERCIWDQASHARHMRYIYQVK